MSLALPTPDFEPSEAHLALHLATFRTRQITPEPAGDPHPGDDEADRPGDHPKLALHQLSLVFGERR
jgi:hypothetical protein